MQWCAYVGLASFAVAWIPQSIETVKAGRCEVNGLFLALSMTGSLALMLYALMRGDAVFSTVNGLTSLGALVNIYYRRFPRPPRIPPPLAMVPTRISSAGRTCRTPVG